MLGFIRNFVPYQGLPIGLDLGQSAVRMAQVENVSDEFRLVHAVEIESGDSAGSSAGLVDALKTAFRSGRFRGRNIAVGLNASSVQVKHVRMPRTSGADFASALKEQAEVALNAPASDFLLRGVVAGEVFGEQSPQQEVVLFATPQTVIQELIDSAAAARASIVGVHVQPRITSDYFGRLHRRKADETAVNLFVDLGQSGTRAFVAAPEELRFVRTMPISTSQVHQKIARSLGVSVNDAAQLRKAVVAQQTAQPQHIPSEQPIQTPEQTRLIDETNAQAVHIVDELEMCRRYYESIFPSQPVTRLVFVGGGARDRLLCSAIAQALSLPAQIGDPLVRFNRTSLPSLACIDRRESMPQWSVAFGLSMCGQTVAHV